LAIQIVYQNACFTYKKEDDSKKQEFKEIIEAYKSSQHLDEIIMQCFECYDEKLWPSELIARVNHVLAHYGKELGEKKLKEQVLKLVKYFRKTVLSDCKRFIENGMMANLI
jgi:predicted hydrocarbon binding protein